MINIAVTGAAGRMGRTLVEACARAEGLRLSAALERAGNAAVGKDAGELAGAGKLGGAVRAGFDGLDFDVLVDFTSPEATLANLDYCRKHGKKLVIGTTGLDDAGKSRIATAARDIAIVFAPNMSVGVNLCFKLLETAARVLGDDVDVEIVVAHGRSGRESSATRPQGAWRVRPAWHQRRACAPDHRLLQYPCRRYRRRSYRSLCWRRGARGKHAPRRNSPAPPPR